MLVMAISLSTLGLILGFAGALRVNRYAMVAGAGIAFVGAALAFVAGILG